MRYGKSVKVWKICFFFVRIFPKRIDHFPIIPFPIFHIFRRTHNRNIKLSAACSYMIPVYEIDMCKFSAVKFAILNGHDFTASEEHASQMSVRIHACEISRLVNIASVLQMNRSRMTILMFLSKVRNHFTHNIK